MCQEQCDKIRPTSEDGDAKRKIAGSDLKRARPREQNLPGRRPDGSIGVGSFIQENSGDSKMATGYRCDKSRYAILVPGVRALSLEKGQCDLPDGASMRGLDELRGRCHLGKHE
jgi:hypothetical protein